MHLAMAPLTKTFTLERVTLQQPSRCQTRSQQAAKWMKWPCLMMWHFKSMWGRDQLGGTPILTSPEKVRTLLSDTTGYGIFCTSLAIFFCFFDDILQLGLSRCNVLMCFVLATWSQWAPFPVLKVALFIFPNNKLYQT